MIEGLGLLYGMRKEAGLSTILRRLRKHYGAAQKAVTNRKTVNGIAQAVTKTPAIPINPIYNMTDEVAAKIPDAGRAYLNDLAKRLMDPDYL